jgi:hypothetical protein
MKEQDDFLIAHVEIANARFSDGKDLGIEFKNQIDAWAKMQTRFRHMIRHPGKRSLQGKDDLRTYHYSFRERLE